MHKNIVYCSNIYAFDMIKYTDENSYRSQLFASPFDQELDENNRWIVLSKILPWDRMAKVYFGLMCSDSGRSTVDLRTIMGAMFIQYSLNLTDRATIEMIRENIYMQYFVGLPSFKTDDIFDDTLLSTFRKRLGEAGARELNNLIVDYSIEIGITKHRKSRVDSKQAEESINSESSDSPTKY